MSAVRDLPGLLGDEWIKLRTVRAPWLLLGVSLLVIVAGVSGRMADGRTDLEDPALVVEAMAHVGLVSLFTLILGVLVAAGEHRYRTVTDTYLSTPRRGRVVAAKLVVTTLAGTVVGLATAVTGLAATAVWFAAKGGTLDLTSGTVARTTLGGIGWCAAFAALGVGIGALVRNLAGAIAASLVWLALVEGVVGELLGEDLARWLPFRSGVALTDLPSATGTVGLTQAQAALTLTAYAAVAAVVGLWATVSRDVS